MYIGVLKNSGRFISIITKKNKYNRVGPVINNKIYNKQEPVDANKNMFIRQHTALVFAILSVEALYTSVLKVKAKVIMRKEGGLCQKLTLFIVDTKILT